MSEELKPVLRVLDSILLNLCSSRTPPRILLKPPIEVTSHVSFQVLTPMQLIDTFLGKKFTIDTKHNIVVYLKEKRTNKVFRVMEATMTFMHIIEPSNELNEFVDIPPSSLPKDVVKQLIAVTMNETIPILVTLFDKHMIPIALPFKMHIEVRSADAEKMEDN